MRRLTFALCLLLPLAACGQQPPSQSQPAELAVTDAWARDTAGTTATAAVFMTIASQADDRLVGASAPIAAKTDLMTMHSDSGAMEMTYLDGIAIPANTPVRLEPSGLHVWLAELHEPLEAGHTFPLVLEFEKAGERRVTVSIIEPAAAAPMSGMKM